MDFPPVTQWPDNIQMDTRDPEWYSKCTLVYRRQEDLK
jgi:hypothetical protein